MRNGPYPTIAARQIRSVFAEGAVGGLSDGELLERFATRSSDDAVELAFAALVERHGSMVFRVARSILGDPHEAQDVFQATFLLLARRAGTLWVRDSLAPWLHSVACRIASGSRAAEARRRALERRLAGRNRRTEDEPARDDLARALHEEIERLPDRLRAPLVLCYLQALTHEQAADQLGCPVGTVRSRLARGRDRLRRGLSRRGFARLDSTSLGSRPAAVPAPMAALAIQAASIVHARASMTWAARCWFFFREGVLTTMSIHPIKSAIVMILFASGAVVAGLGMTLAQEPKTLEKAAAVTAPEAKPADPLSIEKRFEALEQRVRELEFKLESVTNPPRGLPVGLKSPYDQNTLIKIRPRFDNALVKSVSVSLGQTVKKGEPLLVLKSADLAQARNDFRTKFVQWDHDHKFLVNREPLHINGQITNIVWTDTVNDEKKSRLTYLVSREKLITYGITTEQLDKLLEGLKDDIKKDRQGFNVIDDITEMTVLSPIDGVIIQRDVVPGNFYDQGDVLFIITPPKKP